MENLKIYADLKIGAIIALFVFKNMIFKITKYDTIGISYKKKTCTYSNIYF